MKLTFVNGRKYDGDVLREELRAAKGTSKPIDVVAEQASFSALRHPAAARGRRTFPDYD